MKHDFQLSGFSRADETVMEKVEKLSGFLKVPSQFSSNWTLMVRTAR